MYKVLLCLFFLFGCIKQEVPNVLTEKTTSTPINERLAKELLSLSIDQPDDVSTVELTADELQQRRNKPFGEYCASCRRLHPEYYNRFTAAELDPNL